MPVATAIIAAITRAAGTEGVHAAVDPRRAAIPSAPSSAVTPPSPMPAMSSPGYVESPSMSSNVKPASATAASHASMVSDSGGTISRRPSRDAPMPVIAECVLELLGGQRRAHVRAEVRGCDLVDRAADRSASPRSAEHRQPDGPDLVLESSRTGPRRVWPSSSSSGSQSTMLVVNRTRGSSTIGDLRHHVGRRKVGKAEPVVDGERRQGGLARHVAHAHVAAAAVPAHRLRRMDQRIAVTALLDPQHAVGARGPEELVLRVEFGQRSCHRTNSDIASLSSVFGSGSGASSQFRDAPPRHWTADARPSR